MRVVKKRRGYTLHCTDGDFEFLRHAAEVYLLTRGTRDLSTKAKGAVTRRQNGRTFLQVDDDRSTPNARYKRSSPTLYRSRDSE